MAADVWQRVAELERCLGRVRNSAKRDTLNALRDLWVTLAGDLPMLSAEQQAAEIEAVENIHSQVMEAVGHGASGLCLKAPATMTGISSRGIGGHAGIEYGP